VTEAFVRNQLTLAGDRDRCSGKCAPLDPFRKNLEARWKTMSCFSRAEASGCAAEEGERISLVDFEARL